MAADVEERPHLACCVAHHQNRVFAHVSGEEIARMGDLALMAQKEPAAGENPLQLLLVDLGLNKKAPPDQSAIGVDQMSNIYFHQPLLGVFLSASVTFFHGPYYGVISVR